MNVKIVQNDRRGLATSPLRSDLGLGDHTGRSRGAHCCFGGGRTSRDRPYSPKTRSGPKSGGGRPGGRLGGRRSGKGQRINNLWCARAYTSSTDHQSEPSHTLQRQEQTPEDVDEDAKPMAETEPASEGKCECDDVGLGSNS